MKSFFRVAAVRLAAMCAVLPAAAAAQARPAASGIAERPRPTAAAVQRTGPVRVDGSLDDAAWAAATPVTDFTQQRPREGAPSSERTEVRFLFDGDALYIGARMYDSLGAAGVNSRLVRRDQAPQSDALRIDFDTQRDRRSFVQFVVNPAGWRADAVGTDFSWDPVWDAATRVDSLGWTAEMRIPFSQLRFGADSVQAWGMNIVRVIRRKEERAQWSFWKQNEAGGPAFFGELAGLRIHGQPRRLELLPYVVARNDRISSGNPASPFYDRNSGAVHVGGDLRYLPTSNLTLSATANPDFGQVEVDPAVVNLTQYETFFSEKRPFFVEGSSLFDFGMPGCNVNCGLGVNLFYSRRVGRAPQGGGLAAAAGPYADIPEASAILGAVKLTGRTSGGTTLGLLDAVTRREVARVATADSGLLRTPVEPLTNSLVARVRREMRGGNLVVGAIGTSVNRDLGGDPGLRSLLPRSAQTAGLDAEYSWGRRAWRLYGAVAASHLAGDSSAILQVQRSSARYLQRPDRDPGENGLFSYAYDPSARSFNGYGAIVRLSKQGGNWIGDLNGASLSPGFETNDLGFQQIADWRWLNGTVGRQYTKPTRYYRTLTLMGGTSHEWNFDGDRLYSELSGTFNIELPNYWTGFLMLRRAFPSLADRLTRGGPVVGRPGGKGVLVNLSTDTRHRVILGGEMNLLRDDDGGGDFYTNLSATIRPASNMSFSFGPGIRRMRATNQYVGSLADATSTAFFGRRYVFAWLDQRQVYMDTRASVTFTPNLSLEFYAQPFLASGDYSRFQEFAEPRSRELRVYGRDVGTVRDTLVNGSPGFLIDPDGEGPAGAFKVKNPDFNFRSLRGTGVLRWEWRPGSTAYLVWTQRRSMVAPVGNFDFGRDSRALFDAPSDNVFVLKVSYWLGL